MFNTFKNSYIIPHSFIIHYQIIWVTMFRTTSITITIIQIICVSEYLIWFDISLYTSFILYLLYIFTIYFIASDIYFHVRFFFHFFMLFYVIIPFYLYFSYYFSFLFYVKLVLLTLNFFLLITKLIYFKFVLIAICVIFLQKIINN